MGELVRGTVDGVDSPNDVVDSARNQLRGAVNDHPVVVKLLFTVAALLVAGVGLALLEPGNPDNTAMLNVFASLAIVLAYTVVAASVVVGAVMASQWLIGRGRTAA